MRITQKQFDALKLKQQQTSSAPVGKPQTTSTISSTSDYGASFWVPGIVKSERKRQRVFKRKSGESVIGARTDEPDRKQWKDTIIRAAREVCPEPLHGPLILTVYVSRVTPPSWPKKPTMKHPWPWAWIVKPDADNFIKLVSDAIKDAGMIVDDGQFLEARCVKVQAAFDGVLVEITEVKEEVWRGYADMINREAV